MTLERPVQQAHLLNDLPVVTLADGAIVELGELWAGETRRLLLKLTIPAMAALGLAQGATLELRYVTFVTLPISVNVVPADAAAGRLPDPAVTSEVLFLTAPAKRDAERALRDGDVETAPMMYRAAASALQAEPAYGDNDELRSEAELLASLGAQARAGTPAGSPNSRLPTAVTRAPNAVAVGPREANGDGHVPGRRVGKLACPSHVRRTGSWM